MAEVLASIRLDDTTSRAARDVQHAHRLVLGWTPANSARALWAHPRPRVLLVAAPVLAPGLDVSYMERRMDWPAGARVRLAAIVRPIRRRTINLDWQPGTPLGRARRSGVSERVLEGEELHRWWREHLEGAVDVAATTTERMPALQGIRRGRPLVLARALCTATGLVRDPDMLTTLLRTGIGRGRGYGCGLLMIADDSMGVWDE